MLSNSQLFTFMLEVPTGSWPPSCRECFPYLIDVTKGFAILSPLQHNEGVMSAASKIGASSLLLGTVDGFNDDEKEEIQIQSGFWVGRAFLGPLCQRRPIL